jgi:SAM-dependent methyltransferase
MSAFSPDWLDTREPWDHRARSPEITVAMVRWLERLDREGPTRILDLGCGTGSTLRYLAPHLPAPLAWTLAWTLADGDTRLLGIAAQSLGATIVEADLSTADLGSLVDRHDLVTASALLDLVSETWLDRLWSAVERRRAGLLAGLSYDGRIAVTPSAPLDAVIGNLINRHQQGDKGFGRAMGPLATAALSTRARRAGWRVMVRRSDWKLSALADGPGLAMLIGGWAEAAREIAPGHAARIDDWSADRLSRPDLEITVGHRDLLALPPD